MLKKIIQNIKPRSLDTYTPLHELYDTYKGNGKQLIGMILGNAVVSIFVSGLMYQMTMRMFKKQSTIYLFSCFEFGITKTWILTLLLFAMLVYASFRMFRSLKRNFRKNFKDNYLRSDKETYGGAHFQEKEELDKNFLTVKSPEETTEEIFGIDDDGGIRAFTYPNGLNHNKVYIGAPGSGKSAAIIKTDMYQAIYRGDSVVCTDSKGDLYKETSAVARKMGYVVRILNFKSKEFKNSDGFNCMVHLKKDDPEIDSNASVIANIIIKNTQSAEGMDYWGSNEFNLLKALLMYMATNDSYVKAGKNNLPNVFKFAATHGPKDMQAVFTNIPKDNPIRIAYDIFANCSEQNQGQIINGLAIRLSILTNPVLQQVLSHNEIDLTLPMKRKCIYYIVISDTDDTYKFLASLFFNYVFMEQSDYSDSLPPELKKKQLPVVYLLDEYRNIGGIQRLPVNIATVRSRKMYITIILQDIGQLETVHSKFEATTILNSCVIKGLLSTNDYVTAEYFSKLIGDFTALVENEKRSENAGDIIHAKNTVEKSIGEGKRRLMLPEELMNDKFSRDEIIYVISGMAPVKLKKYFSEKAGEAIHPLEIKGRELGLRMCNLHKPKWRKDMEEASAQNNPQTPKQKSDKPLSSPAAPSEPKKTYTKESEPPATEQPKVHSYTPEMQAEETPIFEPVQEEVTVELQEPKKVYKPQMQEEKPTDEKELKKQQKKQLDSEIL